jgi:hypothetical protein
MEIYAIKNSNAKKVQSLMQVGGKRDKDFSHPSFAMEIRYQQEAVGMLVILLDTRKS